MSDWSRPVSRRQFVGRASAAALAATPLAALMSEQARAATKPELAGAASADLKQLTWASGTPVTAVDGRNLSADIIAVTRLGLEGLLTYGREGALQPALAESWSQPDPVTLVYKLRPGVTFWDGSPLTAADVAFSMNMQASASFKSTQATYYAPIKSITATARNEVTVKLHKPDILARYPAAITGIVSEKFWKAHARDIGTPGVLTMGTGPWRFTNLQPNGQVTLAAYDGYWGGKPDIANIKVPIITSSADLLLAMQSGTIDGTFNVPIGQSAPYKTINGVTVKFAPELRVVFLAPNQSMAPWTDIHVRRALAYCVDKAGLLHAVYGGQGSAAPTIVAPQQWDTLLPAGKINTLYSTLPTFGFDLAKARAELAKSSVPSGFSASLEYPDNEADLGLVAQAIAQSASEIGIKIAVSEVPASQWVSDLFSGTKALQIAGFTPDLPDPANLPTALLQSKAGANIAKYSDSQVDRLLTQYGAESSRALRARQLSGALTAAATALAYIPVVYTDFGMAIGHGLAYSGLGPWYMYEDYATHIHAR